MITLRPVAIAMSCAITLQGKGFKLTPQRRLILEAIHDVNTHLTAEDIIGYVEKRAPGINRSTIYRTLGLLEELGCVFRSEIGGRFIYHHAEEGHHHHLVCRSCGCMIDCPQESLYPLQRLLLERYGFQTDLKHVVISGLCAQCAAKSE